MKIALFDPGIEDNQGTPSSNLGDLIIQEAVHRELHRIFGSAEIVSVSTQARIPERSFPRLKESRYILVGGTNLLTSFVKQYRQWQIGSRDAQRVRRAILMGVGWWQYQDPPDWRSWFLWMAALSWRHLHSVRDEYTRSKLAAMGLRNVINTGCPTMWPFLDFDQSTIPVTKAENALLMLTDYSWQPEVDVPLIKLLLASYRTVYFWPQGRRDLDYIRELGLPVHCLEHTFDSLKKFLASGTPVDYIGTRLHGGVFCLLRGKRSLIVEVDNRATEIARDTGLPTVKRGDLETLRRWIAGSDVPAIRLNRAAIEKWRSQFRVPAA